MTDREEREEKLRVLLNDVRRDKQPDTMHARAITEVGEEFGGRFAHLARNQTIVGTDPRLAMPRQPSSSPWASDPLGPEMPMDATDCGDTYIGEPLGTPAEIDATSATPYAQTGKRGSHALASPPVEKFPASPGGAPLSNQSFRRRI
jgi:hypothetical protein